MQGGGRNVLILWLAVKQKGMEYAIGRPRTEDLSAPGPRMGYPAEIQSELPSPVARRQLYTGGGGCLLLIPYGTVGAGWPPWVGSAALSGSEQ